ncbi:MAG TPA: hypothetical protein VGN57_14965 [Pirellulaceae bacterium]|jgi:hypothetical protein|nr:hypothetical protein [Pirellulaceae bacterium]
MEGPDNPYAAPDAPRDAMEKILTAPETRVPLTGLERSVIVLAVVVVAVWLLAMGHGAYVSLFLGD